MTGKEKRDARFVRDVHERTRLARSWLALLESEDGVGEGRGEKEGLPFSGKLVDNECELGCERGSEESVGFIKHLRCRH
jgi:hypothetical protein